MGIVLDTSVLIASERGKLDLTGLLRSFGSDEPVIAAITASELLHGVERASDSQRREKREAFVSSFLNSVKVVPFDLQVARHHARIWAALAKQGRLIGAHDMQIAATAVALGYAVAILNMGEFQPVSGLEVKQAARFQLR